MNRIFAIDLLEISRNFTEDLANPLKILYGVQNPNWGSLDLDFLRIMGTTATVTAERYLLMMEKFLNREWKN